MGTKVDKWVDACEEWSAAVIIKEVEVVVRTAAEACRVIGYLHTVYSDGGDFYGTVISTEALRRDDEVEVIQLQRGRIIQHIKEECRLTTTVETGSIGYEEYVLTSKEAVNTVRCSRIDKGSGSDFVSSNRRISPCEPLELVAAGF